MTPLLIILIVVCLAAAIAGAILVPKIAKSDKQKSMWLIIGALGTIVIHYSGLLYHHAAEFISPGKIATLADYLTCNPNLLFPIYPCNLVMWGLLIMAFLNKESKAFKCFADFLFLFGIVSGVFGLIANGDYFSEATPRDWDIYKSVVAHSIMIFNLLCIPTLGFFKLEPVKNLIRTAIGVGVMAIDGLYCSVVAFYVGGKEMVKIWNAMFLWTTPIPGLEIVRFYIVMPMFLALLAGVLFLTDYLIKKKKQPAPAN